MTEDGGWSQATHSVASVERAAPTHAADVNAARRTVASFGAGDGAGFGESMRSLVRRYGWRAYALPILVVVTIVALASANSEPTADVAGAPTVDSSSPAPSGSSSPASSSAPPVAPTTMPLKSDAAGGAGAQTALEIGQLPDGAPFTRRGTDTYRTLPGTTKVVGARGKLFHYGIDVEKGITGVDLTAFARLVDSTLDDPRSWTGHGVRLQRVSKGPVDFAVTLTSSLTVRKYCGYDVPVETSCYAAAGTGGLRENRVVLNVARWVRGAAPYLGDLATYHRYMINHEVGHAVGHMHAHGCLPGGLAPVMMQQTYGLKSAVTKRDCGANPWPYPPGARGAPGAEAPDTPQNNEYYAARWGN